jgi:hypothetical protein
LAKGAEHQLKAESSDWMLDARCRMLDEYKTRKS